MLNCHCIFTYLIYALWSNAPLKLFHRRQWHKRWICDWNLNCCYRSYDFLCVHFFSSLFLICMRSIWEEKKRGNLSIECEIEMQKNVKCNWIHITYLSMNDCYDLWLHQCEKCNRRVFALNERQYHNIYMCLCLQRRKGIIYLAESTNSKMCSIWLTLNSNCGVVNKIQQKQQQQQHPHLWTIFSLPVSNAVVSVVVFLVGSVPRKHFATNRQLHCHFPCSNDTITKQQQKKKLHI